MQPDNTLCSEAGESKRTISTSQKVSDDSPTDVMSDMEVGDQWLLRGLKSRIIGPANFLLFKVMML